MAWLEQFWRVGKPVLWVLVAYALVAFGQPAWVPLFGLLAAACGYAIFWKGMLALESRWQRFLVAVAWFTAVQCIQLSWMTADDFQGAYIWGVWIFFALAMGLQFGLVSLLVVRNRWTLLRMLAIPAAWTLMEWARLFFSNGFTWNPVGLALTSASLPMQMASFGGVYFLSFWVMLCNVFLLRAARLALVACLVPYIYGAVQLSLVGESSEPPFKALLVQTGLTPDKKGYGLSRVEDALHPLVQWERILGTIKEHWGREIDLILLPEGSVPYRAGDQIYANEWVQWAFRDGLNFPLQMEKEMLGNGDICQVVAELFDADLVAGLEDHLYQAALFYQPGKDEPIRYGKRVLIPLAEEIPFKWLEPICATYGITGSFLRGSEAVVFDGAAQLGCSICYEETFGHMMRENRHAGAEILINLTTDGWYPHSKLPVQHFSHGRLRAVENGIPLLRSCHTGITGAVDCFGRTIATLGTDETACGALYVEVPRTRFRTLYTKVGDNLPVGLSAFLLLLFLRRKR